jgi:small subunit ribosomal protein S9
MERIIAIGRRKGAIARVYMSEGKGNMSVNDRDFADYFPAPHLRYIVEQPLKAVSVEGKYDFKVNVQGGGIKGQAEALRLGIARALVKANQEFKDTIKGEGFLTRDARNVERKKPGQPKARKKTQFSKR